VGDTLRGFPAGCPKLFFCVILERFSEALISPEVFGVLEETLFVGRQYGVLRFSPLLRPHAFPVETSFQSSLNHRLSAAPFFVFRTATTYCPNFWRRLYDTWRLPRLHTLTGRLYSGV